MCHTGSTKVLSDGRVQIKFHDFQAWLAGVTWAMAIVCALNAICRAGEAAFVPHSSLSRLSYRHPHQSSIQEKNPVLFLPNPRKGDVFYTREVVPADVSESTVRSFFQGLPGRSFVASSLPAQGRSTPEDLETHKPAPMAVSQSASPDFLLTALSKRGFSSPVQQGNLAIQKKELRTESVLSSGALDAGIPQQVPNSHDLQDLMISDSHKNDVSVATQGPSSAVNQHAPIAMQKVPPQEGRAKNDAPKEPKVKAQWGRLEWLSSTHVKVMLTLIIPKGYKMYGPAHEDDTIQRPTILKQAAGSANVMGIRVAWPPAQLFQDEFVRAHGYVDTVTIPVDIFLHQRTKGCFVGELTGLLCATSCHPFSFSLECSIPQPPVTAHQWWFMLALAFLGGAILNVMPCVLPVLGLKLKGLVSTRPELFRQSCLWTVGGILSGFWTLASAMVGAQALFGVYVGWGMQLQNPYFTAVMACIMVAGAYNLLGVFHLNPPSWAVQATQAMRSVRSMAWQSWVSGMLGVLLATPCSAPFLGTSVGFALSGSAWEVFSFYTAIALGFALPYMLGIVFPVYRWLPRPGLWMIFVERLMGVLFLASAAWLIVWPLSGFLTPFLQHFSWIIFGFFSALPLIYALAPVRRLPQALRRWILYVCLLSGCVGLVSLPFFGQTISSISMRDGEVHWIGFDEDILAKALQAGRTVFVDATGLGCALCMVNKKALMDPGVQALLTRSDVICMRADFSYADPKILMFLKRYGRAAIPFNVVLAREMPQGIVLSELLTAREIQRAFDVVARVRKHHQSLGQQTHGDRGR